MDKLLEAILKGILMGLEIQDEELDLPSFYGSLITPDYHTGRANQIKWLRDNFVDLGLPSGTLWCKWNIGATNGDTAESWYGNYYAWGETETIENGALMNYKFHDKQRLLTKYNGKDNKETLEPIDDVVSVTLGKDFRMPTKEDFIELCTLQSKWVENYKGVKHLNGRVFIGNNGNKLFIPAAGWRIISCYSDGSYCYLWSSSLCNDYVGFAWHLYFNLNNVSPNAESQRLNRLPVRAVLQIC